VKILNGIDFKEIRRQNRISQAQFAEAVGRYHRAFTYNLEKLKNVPSVFVKALSDIIGVDLNNDEKLLNMLIMIGEQKAQNGYLESIDIRSRETRSWTPDWNAVWAEKGLDLKYIEFGTRISKLYPQKTANDIIEAIKTGLAYGEIRSYIVKNHTYFRLNVSNKC
jgi:transcriptional regulator with XRE-family HTH domain